MMICSAQPNFPVTEMSFCAWLAQAVPGEQLEYHRGFLLLDRDRSYSHLTPPERTALNNLADRAMWAAEQGYVHLLQRRCDLGGGFKPDCFVYLAIARPITPPPGGSLSQLLTEEIAP
ncbi:MAG: hypothetical protein PsegKO_34780 [Pseudohongiellaceae bacterium]